MSNIPPNIPESVDTLPDNCEAIVVKNFINGEFVAAKSSKYIVNKNPATGQILSYIPQSSDEEVNAAVKSAKECFLKGEWSKLEESKRADFLDKIADKIEQNLDKLAMMESEDNGKPVQLARMVDIPRAVANFRFFAGAIRHQQTGCHTMGSMAINYTLRRPVGVAGLITPWNLPLYLLSWKVAPALACGNSVVAKPSELTPMTANALAEIIQQVGLPRGVFNLVHGYGKDCGSAIVNHPDVKLVSFTGGTATGKHVGKMASEKFKKLSLELGGKNPLIIFDDCDFDNAVETAKRAAFTNQGEICLCTSRIFVQEAIYDKFCDAFIQKVVQGMKVGDPKDSNTNVGALISEAHRKKIEYYVHLAKEEGGKILCGGKAPSNLPDCVKNGAFFEPTIIADLDPMQSRVSLEEIFGPVATIHKFTDENDVISKANCVPYGLCASIFTTNLNRAHKMSDSIETGMVWVNTWLLRDLRTPFGGVKESGVGREGGNYSLEFYSEEKNVCIKL